MPLQQFLYSSPIIPRAKRHYVSGCALRDYSRSGRAIIPRRRGRASLFNIERILHQLGVRRHREIENARGHALAGPYIREGDGHAVTGLVEQHDLSGQEAPVEGERYVRVARARCSEFNRIPRRALGREDGEIAAYQPRQPAGPAAGEVLDAADIAGRIENPESLSVRGEYPARGLVNLTRIFPGAMYLNVPLYPCPPLVHPRDGSAHRADAVNSGLEFPTASSPVSADAAEAQARMAPQARRVNIRFIFSVPIYTTFSD